MSLIVILAAGFVLLVALGISFVWMATRLRHAAVREEAGTHAGNLAYERLAHSEELIAQTQKAFSREVEALQRERGNYLTSRLFAPVESDDKGNDRDH